MLFRFLIKVSAGNCAVIEESILEGLNMSATTKIGD
jgi:hypothetical protein